MQAMKSETIPLPDLPPGYTTFAAADGERLAGRLYRPVLEPLGAVLVVPAIGICQDFYEAFACWLAGQGYAVFTFDYRGMGFSRRRPLPEVECTLVDWGRLDCSAALTAFAARLPAGLPIHWLGHSLGGQLLPFVADRRRLARAITVASGSGYWRENAPPLKRRVWWLWYVVAPLSLRLCGYFPGRRLGMVGDLPAGVMAQWRSWCLDPDYAPGVEGDHVRQQFAAVTTPLSVFSFADDEYMSAVNTARLHDLYVGAPQARHAIAPADHGLKRIGHFGFFRAERERLWPLLLPHLEA